MAEIEGAEETGGKKKVHVRVDRNHCLTHH
jgi:hypothetical protein